MDQRSVFGGAQQSPDTIPPTPAISHGATRKQEPYERPRHGPLQDPSADDIVARYVDAIGGKDVLTSIQTIYQEGVAEVMGNVVPARAYVVVGKGYRFESDAVDSLIVNCVTAHGGWTVNPFAGQSNPVALPDDEVKAGQVAFQIGGPLFNYGDKGNTVELIGQATDGGAPLYQVRVTTREGTVTDYYIDAATYYVSKTATNASMNGKNVESTTSFTDYRKTDSGYIVSYAQQTTNVAYVTYTWNKVVINQPIDPALFAMPT